MGHPVTKEKMPKEAGNIGPSSEEVTKNFLKKGVCEKNSVKSFKKENLGEYFEEEDGCNVTLAIGYISCHFRCSYIIIQSNVFIWKYWY